MDHIDEWMDSALCRFEYDDAIELAEECAHEFNLYSENGSIPNALIFKAIEKMSHE